jgi:hypothetical protein
VASGKPTSQSKAKSQKKRKSLSMALSFVGGAAFVSTVVGLTIYHNQAIREEIEHQAKAILSITKSMISQVLTVVEKVNEINQLLRPGIAEPTAEMPAGKQLKALPGESYEGSWQAIEADIQGRASEKLATD